MSISSSPKNDPHPPNQVPDLWFSNNRMVIIRAGSKEFCLPHCILVAHSRVFRETLAAKSGANESGTPILCQLSDPPDHTECFLRALYHSGYFEPPPGRCELDHILGILSLSAKYEVGYLKRRALCHLASGFPLTLDAWRNRTDTSTFRLIGEYSVPYALANIPKTLTVLKILSQVGAFWLLPAAFYECCRYDLQDLITNSVWLDPSFDNGLKKTIIIGYNRQIQESRHILRFLHRPSEGNCFQTSVCLEVRRQHAEESFESWSMNNPLGIWDEGDWLLLEEMCTPCLEAAKAIHDEDCVDLWKRLPALFDLPPWQKLLDLRDSAM